MTTYSRLCAWLEPREERQVLAAYVIETTAESDGGHPIGVATSREPTSQLCSSKREARRWIDEQAERLGLPIEWQVALN